MFIQVQTTTDSEQLARRIASTLVERRLAACVQVLGPATSTYRWQGEVQIATEWLCLIKTTRELYPQLEAALRELHSYQTPEIIALPISSGSEDYLQWLADEVTP